MDNPASETIAKVPVPAHVLPYVDVLGINGTIKFLAEFGGATFYLTADPKGNSEISKFLGQALAYELYNRLVEEQEKGSGHPYRRIPLARPWIACVMRSNGDTIAIIARRLRASDVSVSRWVRNGIEYSPNDGAAD